MTGAAVIGSGNIGTDLMIKLLRGTGALRVTAMAGIDPGLRRAGSRGPPRRRNHGRRCHGAAGIARLRRDRGGLRCDLGCGARRQREGTGNARSGRRRTP